MKNNRVIWKSLMMVTQIGLSMLTPIFLCVWVGLRLDQWLHTEFCFFVMLLLGILSAFRSVYVLTKRFYSRDLDQEIEKQKYFDDLKRERSRKDNI